MSAYTIFFCPHCQRSQPCKTVSDLVGHLGTHIRNDESLICPHENCNRTYNVYSSMTSHIARNYRNFNMYQVKHEYLVPVQVNGDLNDNVGSEHGGEALEVNILMIEDTNEFEQVQFEQNFMKGFSQMLLKIQESLHLPVSTVSIIVDEMKTIVHQSMEYTKEKVLSLLDCNNFNEELKQKITAEFTSNIFSTSVNKFSTPYRRQQFVERNIVIEYDHMTSMKGLDHNLM